ncbi:MAG: hypothetical protein EU539_03930 [Promethearchaeota archaeon]|nr:MAG: hypothetical protein EU539_03930 [Candidatus Lokiarchaeota archaeon]
MILIGFLLTCSVFIEKNAIVATDTNENSNPSLRGSLLDHSGIPICKATRHQNWPRICSDGDGGAIITWSDQRNYEVSELDIYAQKINGTGGIKWNSDGESITEKDENQFGIQMISDEAGGAIIYWEDDDIIGSGKYAQRVNRSGQLKWTINGELIGLAIQDSYKLCSDGAEGAIIATSDGDIYAQRIDSNGVLRWGTEINGIPICTYSGSQSTPLICSDNAGGAVIAWIDQRTSGISGSDIYAQRIDSSGNVLWTPDGITVCNASNNQEELQICCDGAGGAIIAWKDERDNSDIYAQRINAAGACLWGDNGSSICSHSEAQIEPKICSDGNEGAIITWIDYRNMGSPYSDIFIQRINSTGDLEWNTDGVAICTGCYHRNYLEMCSDGAGGAIITWTDFRTDEYPLSDIYAQRINSTGETKWDSNGAVVCTESINSFDPEICSDGAEGAIITWTDSRNEPYTDIYAQRINSTGTRQWSIYIPDGNIGGGGGDDGNGNGKKPPDDPTILLVMLGISIVAGCVMVIIAWKKKLFTKLKRN